jgi:hypothetical protein
MPPPRPPPSVPNKPSNEFTSIGLGAPVAAPFAVGFLNKIPFYPEKNINISIDNCKSPGQF